MRLIPVFLAALFLTSCNPGDFGPEDRFTQEFHYTLKPAERLNVENFNGELEIDGWDTPSIEVTGTKYASSQELLKAIRIDVQESAAMNEIRASRPVAFPGSQGVRLLIHAPRKTIADRIVSSNGAVRIHDMDGSARVRTSNGAIQLRNLTGGADAVTSNGAIELDSVSGPLSLHTSNGRIRAGEITGQCEAESSNGPVNLEFRAAPDGPVRVHTSNGAVDVVLAGAPKDGIRAQTSNGSITLEMPAAAAAHVNARTSGGSITSEFTLAPAPNASESEKHHLEGEIGTGGPLIELTTDNGGISLRKSLQGPN